MISFINISFLIDFMVEKKIENDSKKYSTILKCVGCAGLAISCITAPYSHFADTYAIASSGLFIGGFLMDGTSIMKDYFNNKLDLEEKKIKVLSGLEEKLREG